MRSSDYYSFDDMPDKANEFSLGGFHPLELDWWRQVPVFDWGKTEA